MKTYFILYSDYSQESVKASSVRSTAKLISFYQGKAPVLIVPVSEIKRIGTTLTSSLENSKPPGSGRQEIEKWWRENASITRAN